MSIYVFTGKLGSGKSLCAVGRIKDYLMQNKKVATNIDLNLHNLIGYQSKQCRVFRIPDRPILDDLHMLGLGYDGEYQGEDQNGVIVLDECAQFLNTRNFQDKERKKLIEWFVHARKKRWDVIFIIQHLNALDKQFREMFAEHIVYCNRMDRLRLPFFIRPIAMMLGFSGNLPKIHRALVMYGHGPNAMKVDSWVYTGQTLYDSFSTEQGFNAEHEGGIYQLVPPWYTHGRFHNDWHHFKSKATNFFKTLRLQVRHFFLIGLLSGIVGSTVAFDNEPATQTVYQEPSADGSAAIETTPLEQDNIYITGSMIGSYTEIYFEKNGQPYDPKSQGHNYFVRTPCHVFLFIDGDKRDVYCGSARRRQPATGTQYAATVDSSTQKAASSRTNQGKSDSLLNGAVKAAIDTAGQPGS